MWRYPPRAPGPSRGADTSTIGGSGLTGGRSTQGARVFVIEDDTPVRELVRDRLERDGYRVTTFSDGPGDLKALLASAPDVVILDLTLPTIDGLDVLSAMRRESDVPVIILTGRGNETDRIVGLRMGADDYVVKPFSPHELAARVAVALRRNHRAPPSRRLEFPGLVIDQASHEVFVDDVEAELTSKEFELLNFLASSPRQVFSREQLLNQVWQSEADWQDGATVTEHVHRLRGKIENDPGDPRWITTVRGAGYRFEPEPARDGPADGAQH